MIRQSGRAWPGGSAALRFRVRVRSELTVTPSASVHRAAGRAMSAYALVSVAANTSWVTTSSAASRPSMTRARLATEATGLVPMIQQALICPAAIFSNISTVPRPVSARSVPRGTFQRSSTKARSSASSADRWPGRPGPR